ncbi:hypothetical protein ACU635_35775 [[Actinomadura] parvosata]|uniref:hypothetical protein n=1 Tax=[Actinomadura] parvosata TaxID=1955412 RepID=UPI00406D3AB5
MPEVFGDCTVSRDADGTCIVPQAGSPPAHVSGVEIRLEALPALLATVRLRLQGFLRLVHAWAARSLLKPPAASSPSLMVLSA